MKVYMDTEFTDFKDGRLISIGLITGDGERSFYAELTDNYIEADCSYFVLETVLPLLDAPELPSEVDYKAVYARMTIDQCRHHLNAWFACLQEPVKVISDAQFDHELLRALFRDHPWPATVDPAPHYVGLGHCEFLRYEAGTIRFFDKNHEYRRHHALDDAKAMRLVEFEINRRGN